jgi:hypothetical protein
MSEIVEHQGEMIDQHPIVPEFPASSELIIKLNAKQVDVAERYLTHFDLNRAVQDAYGFEETVNQKGRYPQTVYNYSSHLKKDEPWLQYVAARLNEVSMPASRVLIELARLASVNIEDFLNDEMLDANQAMFDLRKAKKLGVLGCIRRIDFLEKGGVRVELYDKMRALENLAKHYNLLKENEVQIDNYIITVVRDE